MCILSLHCVTVARSMVFYFKVTILHDKYYENEYKCKTAEYQIGDRKASDGGKFICLTI